MKKLIPIILMLVMACTMVTGCSSAEDETATAIEDFTTKDMKSATSNYAKFAKAYGKLNDYETVEDITKYCDKTLIPILDTIIDEVDGIDVEDKEVKSLKSKFLDSVKLYKQGLTEYSSAIEEQKDEGVTKANNTLTKANESLTAYNDSVTELSKKYDLTVKTIK
ncbi:MAG: hypothetical protein PHD70_10250 [Anaerostipes sp.]|jgi:hypothetical protein|nr:hypothetical protein [Anaerostipes sp.]MDD3746838.1 hypothetical protein [Anaerostipes sp.]